MNALNPINYKIHLEPDLENFTFSGNMELLLETQTPVKEIILNILELAIWNCKVSIDGNYQDCSFCVDPQKETLSISLPKAMDGQITLQIDYQGIINDKMAGFYRSKYEIEGKSYFIAVTQFEESDARRAFPCMDHPLKKATFDVDMIVDEDLVPVSNETPIEEIPLDNGKKRAKFQRTPKMSTYLVFFGVGAFESVEDKKDTRVRVLTTPGMTKFAHFGLEFGRQALHFCEEYYGIAYPLPKLDLLAIPDFAFGAMENWGAITFRENLLLNYPEITSKAGEERICEVIAHEIAHQWFGNLVTPSDWKYLWLNESFATYFGYGVVHHYHPGWDVWGQFIEGHTDTALTRDALHETFPIEIPGGEHVVINTSTAPLIYSKGGSILRQIEGYIGSQNFKAGLQHYLKKHAYACADSHHLWEALENVSEMPVTQMIKSWIEQPGYPVIEVHREGDNLSLHQKKFTYLPNESEQKWLVPIQITVFDNCGGSKNVSTLLKDKTVQIELGSNAITYKVNSGQTGFYRVKYKTVKDFHALGKRILDKTLSSEDRWGVQNDLYATVRSGDASLDEYLDYLSNYENEDAFLPLISIAGNIFQAFLLMDGSQKEKVSSLGKSLIEKTLSRIGFEPSPQEPHTTSILRDRILWQAVLYGSKDAAEFGRNAFNALVRSKPIHPDILKSVMMVGAMIGRDDVFDWFDKQFQSSQSEHERMNILAALGCFRDITQIEKTQQYVLEKVPDRNKFIPIVSLSLNPHAIPIMWDWYVSNLNALEQFHPMLYERVIASIVPVCGMMKAPEVKKFFKSYLKENEKVKDVVNLSLEKLDINLRMRTA
jgi:tricorn protease interacting factor F2/3